MHGLAAQAVSYGFSFHDSTNPVPLRASTARSDARARRPNPIRTHYMDAVIVVCHRIRLTEVIIVKMKQHLTGPSAYILCGQGLGFRNSEKSGKSGFQESRTSGIVENPEFWKLGNPE